MRKIFHLEIKSENSHKYYGSLSALCSEISSATENGIEATNPHITKREYFAAMALQGLCANPILKDVINKVKSSKEFDSYTANTAISIADALINALIK